MDAMCRVERGGAKRTRRPEPYARYRWPGTGDGLSGLCGLPIRARRPAGRDSVVKVDSRGGRWGLSAYYLSGVNYNGNLFVNTVTAAASTGWRSPKVGVVKHFFDSHDNTRITVLKPR